jgi:hypothetical protein
MQGRLGDQTPCDACLAVSTGVGRPGVSEQPTVLNIGRFPRKESIPWYNRHYQPFGWTATADPIPATIARRCKAIAATSH